MKRITKGNVTSILDGIYNLGLETMNRSVKSEYKNVFAYVNSLIKKSNFDKAVLYLMIKNLVDQDSGFWQDYSMDVKYNMEK